MKYTFEKLFDKLFLIIASIGILLSQTGFGYELVRILFDLIIGIFTFDFHGIGRRLILVMLFTAGNVLIYLLLNNIDKSKKDYSIEKIYAIIKYEQLVFVVDVQLRIYCILFYPIGYLLRKPVRAWYNSGNKLKFILSFPLWILLNDGNSKDIGYQWFWDAKGIQPTNAWNRFRLAYLWNPMRNPCWNGYQYINPKTGAKTDLDVIFNYKFNHITSLFYYAHNDSKNVLTFNVLKWKNADGEESDNIGETIDFDKAVLGKSLCYYRIDGELYFRYSKAYISEQYTFLKWTFKFAREVQLGAADNRFKIRNKLKFIKL